MPWNTQKAGSPLAKDMNSVPKMSRQLFKNDYYPKKFRLDLEMCLSVDKFENSSTRQPSAVDQLDSLRLVRSDALQLNESDNWSVKRVFRMQQLLNGNY